MTRKTKKINEKSCNFFFHNFFAEIFQFLIPKIALKTTTTTFIGLKLNFCVLI